LFSFGSTASLWGFDKLDKDKKDAGSIKLPAGMPMYVQLNQNYAMRSGQAVEARVSYPIYAEGQLVLPVGSLVTGRIRSLQPARDERRAARWNADFTPLHRAEVVFDHTVAAGIGYYTAAREVYSSWIARGRDVSFAQNTRIEIAVQPRTGASLPARTK
jgi:hypothetical protein